MFRSKLQFVFLAFLAFAAVPSISNANVGEMRFAVEDVQTMSPQLLHAIFSKAVQTWPTGYDCTYGKLRSGYNAGTVGVDEVAHPAYPNDRAFNVTFEGITVCVLIPA